MLASTTGSKPLQYIGEQQIRPASEVLNHHPYPVAIGKTVLIKKEAERGKLPVKIEIIPKVIL